jgi:tetratricopeptide (TPR) repeat protein
VRSGRASAVVVLAPLLTVAPALGAGQNDYDGCMQHADLDRTVAGCTAIIDDIGESNRNRRIAYDNRGAAWHHKRDNDRAIADYTEALHLNPKEAIAYNNRGTAWRDKGNLDRALADFNQAIRLDPNDAAAYNNRGNVRHEKSDNKAAVADYTEAIRLDPKYAVAYVNRALAWYAIGDKDRVIADCTEAIGLDQSNAAAYRLRGYSHFGMSDFADAARDLQRVNELALDPHAALWLFLARARAGEDGTIELTVNTRRAKMKDWPAPVIDLYLGRRSIKEMRAAAQNPAQGCDAAFFGGEWKILRGNAREAKLLLQAAARNCAKTTKESSAATAELKRMKP